MPVVLARESLFPIHMTGTIDVTGKWYNQHGSEIDLAIGEGGRLRGTFRSNVGFPEPDEPFEAEGFVNGALISFVVSFGKYDSVTSWTGHAGVRDGKETLYCLWHMSVGLPPGREAQLWQGTWAGADTFLRERRPSASQPDPAKPSHPVGTELGAAA